MATSQIYMTISIVSYLALMVVIGWVLSKRNNDTGDFYLGGRKLGPLVTAMSAEASDMSSWLLMGIPGLAYLSGCSEVFWTVLGLGAGTYLNWLIVAGRIRYYSEKADNAITLPDFFANRFEDKKSILLAISAVIIIIFFVPYTASGFAACGKLFHSLFGIDYMPAMIASAIVIILYTALGGFLAASMTDFLQSIIMSFAIVVILIFGINVAGGVDQVMENGRALSGYFDLTKIHDPITGESHSFNFITIVSTLAWGLGYFGMPHILLRFMAIEDHKKLKLSRRIATVWVFIAMFTAMAIGIVGYGTTVAGVIKPLQGPESETIIVQLSNLLASYSAPAALVAGLIISGILASTMSTADSQLLAASSSISQNLIKGVFKVSVSKRTEMIIARLTLVGIAIVGMFLARDPNSSVFRIVSFAWAGFGASFGPLVLFALFWKRTNIYGALAGVVSGGAMVFIWKFLVRPIGGAWDIYELLPAFLVATFMIIVVSLLTPPPSEKIIRQFEEVAAMK